jgi:hypothetical protein
MDADPVPFKAAVMISEAIISVEALNAHVGQRHTRLKIIMTCIAGVCLKLLLDYALMLVVLILGWIMLYCMWRSHQMDQAAWEYYRALGAQRFIVMNPEADGKTITFLVSLAIAKKVRREQKRILHSLKNPQR